ncbi:tryptophan synthase subunit alpha [Aureitalea marina]|uniref:Tryptophan synthase alpha chain n=1 Tax=Aureitalea marina TaxID=930804 RepID=A0A2S7KQI4_9FLAO|nr:tryptophan synthase subunit alpha [Aureitalea marina]PQB04870.1 tryptophan synthase subunit alpha [Aureitalea marina]
MSERIKKTFESGKKLLSIYFTAGYPELNDTRRVIRELEDSGADMIEIGLPFSDPLADGPTIQESSTQSLQGGMHTELLFQQLEGIREEVEIPLLIMGYFNPVLQYGVEDFCRRCQELGIDGLILPDLPLAEYQLHYEELFKKYGLTNVFLITPQTSEERIRQIDEASDGFIYMVSSASTTGVQQGFGEGKQAYFDRIASMKLRNPTIVGFGIGDSDSFRQATRQANGAIIGSAFIRMLTADGIPGIKNFIKGIIDN